MLYRSIDPLIKTHDYDKVNRMYSTSAVSPFTVVWFGLYSLRTNADLCILTCFCSYQLSALKPVCYITHIVSPFCWPGLVVTLSLETEGSAV